MAEVILEQLTKRYGEFVAVDGLDLCVRDRELLVLVGPSGCGKTTVLRLIAGLENVTSGVIRIGDRVANDLAPKARDVAMVFQNFALYPHLNVYNNLAFGLRMRHVLKADIDSRVRRAASVLGIEAFLSRRPAELSGGQRQRVALGRALVRDPQVFLWDEPLSNLDAQLRDQMRTELVKLQRQLETTTIHVTHDQVEAMMMAQRIAVMREGRLQQIGPPLDVYNAPANRFVAEFIGSPPMNFRTGTLAKTGDDLGVRFSEFIVPLPPDRLPTLQRWAGRDVTLGIRPEHITTVRPTGQELPSLRAEVVLAQSVGAETFLDLRCGDWEFTVRSDSRHTYRSQELIDIYVSPSQCHLFDPASGKAL